MLASTSRSLRNGVVRSVAQRAFSRCSRLVSASSATASASVVAPFFSRIVSTATQLQSKPAMRFYSTEDGTFTEAKHIRNLAICAHVDHGKTTLVDKLLEQSGTNMARAEERAMDSMALEKERGITIMSKWTSVKYNDYTLNIVDTPGHADFGGEVERILSMVDCICLLVDATEGPMAQTKFILSKALRRGLRPLVIINKVDRETARLGAVENEIFDLFVTLEATDAQLEFPILYASAREGWAVRDIGSDPRKDMSPLFDAIVNHVPAPRIQPDLPFKMLVSSLEYNKHFGRVLTGRIYSGNVRVGDKIRGLSMTQPEEQKDKKGFSPDGPFIIEEGKVFKLLSRRGLEQIVIEECFAGDIVSVAGLSKTVVTDTISSPEVSKAIETSPLDPPIVSVFFSPNTSPLAGKEGTQCSALLLQNRLLKEAETNITLKVKRSDSNDAFEVMGRGEMQIGVLIEQMRREGFEFAVSGPRVLYKRDETTGKIIEPFEEVTIDVDDEYAGIVIEKMSMRKADIKEYKPSAGKTRLIFECPARSLIGYRSEFKTQTHGTGVLNHTFLEYRPFKGELSTARKGVLISTHSGTATGYALDTLQARGALFIGPGAKIYEGMVVGENSRDTDLEVNPTKEKHLSNMRSVGKEEAVCLKTVRDMPLEEALCYIQSDELIEVTPQTIRLRKRVLDSSARKQYKRKEIQV